MRLGDVVREKASLLAQLPWGVVAPALLATFTGLAFIHSASTDFTLGGPSVAGGGHALKQLGFAITGLMLMLALALSPQGWLSRGWPVAIVLGMLALASVMAFGRTVNGAKSWLMLGPFGIQPSELCKPLLVVALAGYLRYHRTIDTARTLAACLLITGCFFVPILLQPDFGTSMIFVPMVACMVVIAGGNRLYVGAIGASGAAAVPLAYLFGVFKAHQMKRIEIWLSAFSGQVADQSGDGYQITHSMIAIGSGGLWGKGFGEGTQSQLAFLPERHTDFIFAVFAEELGLAGVLAFLFVYFMMCERILAVARETKDPFGRLVCVGIATMFVTQALINIGMASGLMPITGLTLPFMSYGGSSLLTAFFSLGLVANVAVQPQRLIGRETF